jgi:hypothetical protein
MKAFLVACEVLCHINIFSEMFNLYVCVLPMVGTTEVTPPVFNMCTSVVFPVIDDIYNIQVSKRTNLRMNELTLRFVTGRINATANDSMLFFSVSVTLT